MINLKDKQERGFDSVEKKEVTHLPPPKTERPGFSSPRQEKEK